MFSQEALPAVASAAPAATRDELLGLSIAGLRDAAKAVGLANYRNFTKEQLADGIVKHRLGAKVKIEHSDKSEKSLVKKSLVKQGVLKAMKSKVSCASTAGAESADRYFCFSGFPLDADPYRICSLVREYIHDFLNEVSVEMIGSCIDGGSQHVGIKFNASDTDILEQMIYEQRDRWV